MVYLYTAYVNFSKLKLKRNQYRSFFNVFFTFLEVNALNMWKTDRRTDTMRSLAHSSTEFRWANNNIDT